MRAGINVPLKETTLLPDASITVEAALEHLRKAVARFDSEVPNKPHPFLGRLRNKDEYLALMLRHSELHLSFVHPAD
jgi:hypothetical protein